jgi:hypothetical protein
MTKKRTLIIGGVVGAIAVGGTVTGVAVAGGNGESDHRPITGPAYEKATTKAIEVVGGGHVTETEQNDEESYYQVEVTKDDGASFDVNLDQQYNVVKTKRDGDSSADD